MPSSPPLAKDRPSGLKATLPNSVPWPSRRRSSAPVATSQSLRLPSLWLLASRSPSGLSATAPHPQRVETQGYGSRECGPAAPKVSQSIRTARSTMAPTSFALRSETRVKPAPRRSAPSKLAEVAFAPSSLAPPSLAEVRLARTKHAPSRFACVRSAPTSLASVRSAPARFASRNRRPERSCPRRSR